MKVREVIALYKTLGELNVSKMEISERIKIVRTRKNLRPHFEEIKAYEEDLRNTLKPEGFDEKVLDFQKRWDSMSEEERNAANFYLASFDRQVYDAAASEYDKDVDVEIEKLSDEGIAAVLPEVGGRFNALGALELMF